jgi:endonuclease G
VFAALANYNNVTENTWHSSGLPSMAETVSKQSVRRPFRRDIQVQDNAQLSATLQESIERLRTERRPNNAVRSDLRFQIRKSLIEPDRSDPNGYERVLGISDLLSVNFLSRAEKAARAVCKITIPMAGGAMSGTGFLVGKRLLLTNYHVLDSIDAAAQASIEFECEHDVDGALRPSVKFNLAEGDLFFPCSELDFTLVAVAPLSETGVPIERYGYLPLIPLSGKGVHGERVTIVQHPGGQPKQIAIHSSRIIELPRADHPDLNVTDFIHYTTDTEPGSSGAPVFNDQWQVVALHHKAVPAPGSQISGTHSSGPVDYESVEWIANEGVRVSAIFQKLQSLRLSDPVARTALERIENAIGIPRFSAATLGLSRTREVEADRKAHDAAAWPAWGNQYRLGYDPKFITFGNENDAAGIELSTVLGERAKAAAPLREGNSFVLDYLHFSVVVHAERRFPMLTAVNVDGSQMVNPGSRSSGWRRDARMDEKYQPGGNFYEKKRHQGPVQFSRGHMVRRADPCWGTEAEAKLAEEHTFHYSNAAPQVQRFNDVDWGNLEDHLLDIVQRRDARMTVFTGPIFREADPEYGKDPDRESWKIPTSYWKVAVLKKPGSRPTAAGFIIGQIEYVRALYEKRVFTSLTPYSNAEIQARHIQTSISAIEKITSFNFAALRRYELMSGLEATRFIVDPGDIVI